MNCTNCGSALTQPTGFCGTCGQPTASPPAWPPHSFGSPPGPAPDVTAQFTVPADLYAAPPPPYPHYDPAHAAYEPPTQVVYHQPDHTPPTPGLPAPGLAASIFGGHEYPAPEYGPGNPHAEFPHNEHAAGIPPAEAAPGYPPQYGHPPQPYPQPQVPTYYNVPYPSDADGPADKRTLLMQLALGATLLGLAILLGVFYLAS